MGIKAYTTRLDTNDIFFVVHILLQKGNIILVSHLLKCHHQTEVFPWQLMRRGHLFLQLYLHFSPWRNA